MTLSTYANIFGIIAILALLPLLVNGAAASRFYMGLMKNEAFARICGAIGVVIAALVLKDGYTVGKDVVGLLTLVVWIGLVKGVILSWYPGILTKQSNALLSNAGLRPIVAIAGLVVGVLVLYGATLL